MNWPTYDRYKDSEVPWLGLVPEHWTTGSFARFGNFEGGSGFPHDYQGQYDQDLVFHKVNALGRASRTGSLETRDDTVSYSTAAKLGATVLPPRTPVFAKVGAALLLGRVATVSTPSCIDNNMMAFVPNRQVIPAFARLLLAEVRFDLLVNPGAVPSINEGQMRRLQTAVPPVTEQIAILDVIERETTKIDALIAKQEQLIVTLREDRAATITQAVTKGLNPDSKMKDSGIEWAEFIPEGWEAHRMSWLFSTISSGTTPDSKNLDYYEGDTNWVTTGELREGYVEATSSKVTALALTDHSALRIYEPGSLVIAMYGATIGRLGILSVPACTNQACCVFAAPKHADIRFMFYVLQAAREHLLVLASGGGQPNINQDKLRGLRVPVPNLGIQREIAAYLDNRCAKIDALIGKSTSMIEILREYRSTLITDAVTGKIDVRGVA